jgi:hypothetical protein
MNIGVPHGFIQFNTMSHKVLMYLSTVRYAGQRQVKEDVGGEARHISVTLTRLHRYGYIYKVGRERPVGVRSYTLFSLNPNAKAPREKKQSGLIRSRTYRTKLKLRVSSVFNFRGEIHVADQSTT